MRVKIKIKKENWNNLNNPVIEIEFKFIGFKKQLIEQLEELKGEIEKQ